MRDARVLHSAEGWFALGNLDEANLELDKISLQHRSHPDVLFLRWQIYAREQNWSECLLLALSWTEQSQKDPRGWIALAETFYHKNQLIEAYELAAAKARQFPRSWKLLYNAARYACLIGKRAEAEQYFQLAMAVGDARALRLKALQDPDLQRLRMP